MPVSVALTKDARSFRLLLLLLSVAVLWGAHADSALASGGAWSKPAPTIPGVDESFGSVSCPTSSFCAAVIQKAADTRAYALIFHGSSWGRPVQIASGDQLQPDFHVSCASPTFCAAVDTNGFAVRYNGHAWTKPVIIPGLGGSVVDSIACPSASFCTAVAYDGSLTTFNGRSWRAPFSLGPVGSITLTAVSCSTSASCVAADTAGAAYSYDGRSWSPATTFATIGNVYGLSCPTSSFCMAVDDGGGSETYVGGHWDRPVATGKLHTHVACASAGFCVTDDAHGYRVFNGLAWSRAATLPTGSEMDSVSCPAVSFCAAVGRGRVITFNWTKALLIGALALPTASASRSATLRAGGYRFTFRPPAVGNLSIRWYAHPRGNKRILVASGLASFQTLMPSGLQVALTRSGRRFLQHARRPLVTAQASFGSRQRLLATASRPISFGR